jgi:poly(3-hydroxybutyrate) depolymerase
VRHLTGVGGLVAALAIGAVGPATASAQELPRGVLIDQVACAEHPAETYALYLPSDYSPDRAWNLLLAFHPGARGEQMVALYRAAAERYGYIVAGSTTSRNGPWAASADAVGAVSKDLARRFAIDAERVYLTGHSGGARLALEVALGPNDVAGVIASSAGFADARPRRTVRFAVFATTGRDDFNYREMRALDAALTTPHALAVFDGGHTLPPPEVAMQAIEWLELQAMRSGRRERDAALVERWFGDRQRAVEAETQAATKQRLLGALVADFDGLRDTTTARTALNALTRETATKTALAADRSDLALEERLLNEALDLEARLRHQDTRGASLARLGAMLAAWSSAAQAPVHSAERSRARRLLAGLAAGAAGRTADADYRALVQRYRWRN